MRKAPVAPVIGSAEGRWRGLVAAQRGSGLSVPGFCRVRGVALSSFYAWRRRLASGSARPAGPSGGEAAGFVEVRTAGSGFPYGRSIELRLEPGGARVLSIAAGFDVRLLQEVIRAVEAVGVLNAGAADVRAADARTTDAGATR